MILFKKFRCKYLINNLLSSVLSLVRFDCFTHKLINITKKIFFYVEAICNLAIEFNGLVSTKGWQKC